MNMNQTQNELQGEEVKKIKRKPYKISELEYMCKFIEFDGLESVADALDRTVVSVEKQYTKLKKSESVQYFKQLNIFWV
jgi:predicted nuclease of restriction endonuclease-like (RecB) superfamily